MLSFFSKGHANYSTLANSFSFKNVEGGEIKLQDYKDRVIIVVNVASKCGFTNQYEDLQTIWSKYKSEARRRAWPEPRGRWTLQNAASPQARDSSRRIGQSRSFGSPCTRA